MQIVFHIGLHKTGTTTLQSDVFKRFNRFKYIELDRLSEIFRPLAFSPKSVLVKDVAMQREIINSLKSEESVIYSNEMLAGWPTLGYVNRDNILTNLHCLFPTARIIVSIREQISLLRSLYKHYLKQGGTKSIEDLLMYGGKSPGYTYINPRAFCYSGLLELLYKLFGFNNVLVLPLELMSKDFDQYLSKMSLFLDDSPTKTNPPKIFGKGYAIRNPNFIRILNRLRKTKHNHGLYPINRKIISLLDSVSRLSPRYFDILDTYQAMYRDDNLEIDKKYGLNLPSTYFSDEIN